VCRQRRPARLPHRLEHRPRVGPGQHRHGHRRRPARRPRLPRGVNRAAALLGTEVETIDPGLGIRNIEGIGLEDAQRLQEENITSVHALAFSPAPRLFFNTSQHLQRICDWQDQALLTVTFGETRAKQLREHFQIRGASDAQRLAADLDNLSAEVLQQLVVSLNMPSPTHLRQLFARLLLDRRIDELRAYRSAVLRIETVVAN